MSAGVLQIRTPYLAPATAKLANVYVPPIPLTNLLMKYLNRKHILVGDHLKVCFHLDYVLYKYFFTLYLAFRAFNPPSNGISDSVAPMGKGLRGPT